MADLDHTTVQAPYLRLTETHPTPSGDVIALWHLRITQPNQTRVHPHAMHSTEHALIYALRLFDPRAFLAAPMGCATGLYITAINITDYDEMEANVVDALTWLGKQKAVPWADEVHCGMYRDHDLGGAQELAAGLLSRRDEWRDPGPNAREITMELTAEQVTPDDAA
jgi:S-ribosylhomocysteine lyase